jgi:hypothetical protein
MFQIFAAAIKCVFVSVKASNLLLLKHNYFLVIPSPSIIAFCWWECLDFFPCSQWEPKICFSADCHLEECHSAKSNEGKAVEPLMFNAKAIWHWSSKHSHEQNRARLRSMDSYPPKTNHVFGQVQLTFSTNRNQILSQVWWFESSFARKKTYQQQI